MKSIFEQSGGVYTMQGDYRLPNLTLPTEEERPIGVWGQRRLRYLKQPTKSCITICSFPENSIPTSSTSKNKLKLSFLGL